MASYFEASHKKIQSLSAELKAVIRTGVALTNLAQVVEELVLNSIDAGATSIAVRVDLPDFKVQVVDNGSGISLEQFSFIGHRYSTSKCHSVQDLENLKYFGYRGEALASLVTASAFMEISSRTAHSRQTYTKQFLYGKPLPIVQAETPRPSAGTTVTATDLFHNLPVRRKRLSEALEMEGIRYRLSGLALMWPRVSFSLRDDAAGHVILQTHKCSGVAAAFSNIFTPARARKLMEVEPVENNEFKISGLVSKEGYSRKDLQFVFVNKRLVLKSSVHKQVNKILGRSLILKRKALDSDIAAKLPTIAEDTSNRSPVKQGDRYGVFVISIECPYKSYDITFDPSKTLVEFRDWPKLIHLLQDMLYPFLRKNNLLASGESLTPLLPGGLGVDESEIHSEDASSESSQPVNIQAVEENKAVSQLLKYGRNICFTDTQNGILSKAVCRPKKPEQYKTQVNPYRCQNTQNSLRNQFHSVVSDDDLTLETPLVVGTESNRHSATLKAEKYNNRHKICHKATLAEHKQTAEEMPVDKTKSGLCEGTKFSKDFQILSSTSSHPRVKEYSEHENSHSLQNTTKTVRFNSEENKVHSAFGPIVSKAAEPSCKRKEITLSTGLYTSSLRQLRESIQGENGSGQMRKVPEINTNSLQQLRRSARQALSELGDLYRTPERAGSRRKSQESCSSVNDEPIATKQAKLGQHSQVPEDTEDFRDIGDMFIIKQSQLLHTHPPMDVFEIGSLHPENEKPKAPVPYIRDQEINHLSLSGGTSKQETCSTAMESKPVNKSLLDNRTHNIETQAPAFSTETDRQSVIGNTSRSQLRPLKSSLNSELFPASSHTPDKSDHIAAPCGKQFENLRRKSPRRLTHSNKLSRLMKGEHFYEESTSRGKAKFFLKSFQFKRDARSTEDWSDSSDLHSLGAVAHRKEQPKRKNRNRMSFNSSEESDHYVPKIHECVIENKTDSVLCLQDKQGSKISREIYYVGNSNIFSKPENFSEDARFDQAASRHEKESLRPIQEPCTSSFTPARQEKILRCCRCVYLRSKSRQPCSLCGKSFSVNKDLPFQEYETVNFLRTEKSSPKLSVVLSLPILQNQQDEMNEESCGRALRATGSFETNREANLCGRGIPSQNSKDSIGEKPSSTGSQKSQGFTIADHLEPLHDTMDKDDFTKIQTREDEKLSPLFVSQGFSINRALEKQSPTLGTHEIQKKETKFTPLITSSESFASSECEATYCGSAPNGKTAAEILISKEEIGLNTTNLIISPGADSDVYFEAGLSEIHNLLHGSLEVSPKRSCNIEYVAKDTKDKSTEVEWERESGNSVNVSSNVFSNHVSATTQCVNDIRSRLESTNVFKDAISHDDNQHVAGTDEVLIKHNVEPNTLKIDETDTPEKISTICNAITCIDRQNPFAVHDQQTSASEVESTFLPTEIYACSKATKKLLQGLCSLDVTTALDTESLSHFAAVEKHKVLNYLKSPMGVCTIPGTESLTSDKCNEPSLNKKLSLASSKLPVQCRAKVTETGSSFHNNSQSLTNSVDEGHSKTNAAQCTSQKSSNAVIESSQTCSLTLAQRSCNLLDTIKEDSDSFSIFSKPIGYDCHTDLAYVKSFVEAKDKTLFSESAVTECSESLFESGSSETKSNNSSAVAACKSSSNGSFLDSIINNLPLCTEFSENNESNGNINRVVKDGLGSVTEMPLKISGTDIDLVVNKTEGDENIKPSSATFSTPEKNQWSSGDQALLLVEMPDENPTFQTSQRHSAEQIDHIDKSKGFDSSELNCGGVLSSTQSLPQEAAGMAPKKPITISAGIKPGTLHSSLSLLRDHVKLARESQACNNSTSKDADQGRFDKSCATKNFSNARQTQGQEQSVRTDQEASFVQTSNRTLTYSCNADSCYSLLNEEDHLNGENLQFTSSNSGGLIRASSHLNNLSAGKDCIREKDEEAGQGKQQNPTQEMQAEKGHHDVKACWRKETDFLTGRAMYVNNQSGHTVTQEQWPEMSSQSLMELTTVHTKTNVTEEQELEPLAANSRQVITDVINTYIKDEEAEADSKWRGGRKRYTYEKEAGMDVSTLLAKWKNPVFSHYKQVFVDAEICASTAVAKSCFDSMSKIEFTKDMLEKIKVIGQVDNKFIACEMEHSKHKNEGFPSSFLVLLDQHAVHERIRLEYYTQECYLKDGDERTNVLKKAEVNPEQTIVMDQDNVRILKAFRREFARIGVNFSVDERSRTTVQISSIPACLLEREPSEVKRRRAMSVEEKTECLIKEHINLLKSTNGACGSLPLTVHKHLCSLACHGAVKFGDQLTSSECKDLLSALARCNLPFQCAHGRPSVAPIVNITELEKELTNKKRKPSLWKIAEAITN